MGRHLSSTILVLKMSVLSLSSRSVVGQKDRQVKGINDTIADKVSRVGVSGIARHARTTRAQQGGQIEHTDVAIAVEITGNRRPNVGRYLLYDLARLRCRAVFSYCTAPSRCAYHLADFVPRAGASTALWQGRTARDVPRDALVPYHLGYDTMLAVPTPRPVHEIVTAPTTSRRR